MATLSNAGILTTGLTFAYDMANSRSFLGQPATNLYGQNLGNVNAIANWDKPTAGTATITDSVATSYGTFNGNRIWLVTVSAGTVNSYSSWRNCLPAGYDATYGTTRRLNFKVCMLKGSISSLSSHNGGGNSGYNAANWTAIDPSTVKDCEQKSGWYQFDADVSGSYPSGHCVGLAILSGDLQFLVTEMQVTNTSFRVPFTPFSRSNTQSIVDLTGNYSITPTSITYDNNNQFQFNGSSDYLSLPSDVEFKSSGGHTVENWFKLDVVNAGSLYNFIGASVINYHSWYWCVYTSKLAIWNVSPGAWYFGSTTIQPNTWYQAVMVTNAAGTGIQFYLNGVAESGTHASYAFNPSYSGLKVGFVGRGDSTNARYFDGLLPITRIYNRALSAAEVKQNFNANRGRYGI